MEQRGIEPDMAVAVERQEQSSWEEIAQTQQHYIYKLAYRLCGNQVEAEDLTQETFLKAFENLAGFRQEAGLRTWLYHIAVNGYLAKRRRRLKHESITLEVLPAPDWSSNPERVVIRREPLVVHQPYPSAALASQLPDDPGAQGTRTVEL